MSLALFPSSLLHDIVLAFQSQDTKPTLRVLSPNSGQLRLFQDVALILIQPVGGKWKIHMVHVCYARVSQRHPKQPKTSQSQGAKPTRSEGLVASMPPWRRPCWCWPPWRKPPWRRPPWGCCLDQLPPPNPVFLPVALFVAPWKWEINIIYVEYWK